MIKLILHYLTMAPKPLSIHRLEKLIIWFYVIAFIGTVMPFTHKFFITIIPWAILFNFFIVMAFHMPEFSRRTKWCFFLIAVGGLGVEYLVAHTGNNPEYGTVLGSKLLGIPLITGINWLVIIYCSAAITSLIRTSMLKKVLLGALITSFYYLIFYIVILGLGNESINELYNLITGIVIYFVMAFIFHLLIRITKIKIWNRLAMTVFLSKLSFLLGLFICKIAIGTSI